jgi:hypothetical protein
MKLLIMQFSPLSHHTQLIPKEILLGDFTVIA